jgi:hypothetical protein
MTIFIETDLGRPVPRAFLKLPTASARHFGTEPPSTANNEPSRIWAVEGDHAYAMGITNPKGFGKTWAEVPPGANPIDCIRSKTELFPEERTWVIEPMNIPPGRYFPRIARPDHQQPGGFPAPFYRGLDFAHQRASASIQIAMLADRLRNCFQVVGPSEPNFEVFGGEFRNILLLAATEVEAQWKGILRANHYDAQSPKPRWSTHDYFKLEAALRLADYAIEFPEYPWIKPVAPFRGWSAANPTGSIGWYEAYNLVKHDRELHGNSATLIRSLEAVAAVVVVGVAQFGIRFVRNAARWRDLFQVHEYPRWSIGDTHGPIFEPGDEEAGEPLDFPF